jgi:Ca2+-binding EF-hand superfamily protein
MFKIKSVVFIVLILAVCSVLAKVSNLKSRNSSKMNKGKLVNKQGEDNHRVEDPVGEFLNYLRELLVEGEDPNALKKNRFGEDVHFTFNYLDSDEDGKVTFDESIETFKEITRSFGLNEEETERELKNLQAAFERLDKDNNGGLDLYEYAELYREFLREVIRRVESIPCQVREEVNKEHPNGINMLKVKALFTKEKKSNYNYGYGYVHGYYK